MNILYIFYILSTLIVCFRFQSFIWCQCLDLIKIIRKGLQIKITTLKLKQYLMQISGDSHQQRLDQIRQKYGGKSLQSEFRPRTCSQYKPSSTYIPSDSTKRSYFENGSTNRTPEQKYRRENMSISVCPKGYQNSVYDSPALPKRDDSIKMSKNREIEKIREEYAASRKKVIEDFTKQPTIPSANDYQRRPFDKYDVYPSSSILNKPQLTQAISATTFKKDYTHDVYKRIPQRENLENPQLSSKYSLALEKAYQFGKNISSGKVNQSNLRADSYSHTRAMNRQFGKQYNIDEHRLSFGKIDSPDRMSKKYELLDRYYQNSSPIKKVQNVSDLQSKYASRDLSPSKYERYDRQNFESSRDGHSNYGIVSSRPNFDSPSKYGQWGVGNIDRMQTRIQSILDEKKMRY